MNKGLEAARHDYDKYFAEVVNTILRLSEQEQDTLSFEEIAFLVPDRSIRREYRSRAIRLLEANLREHYLDRPDALEAWRARNTSELRDWQSVASEWEQALWALVSQGDA